MAKFIIDTTDNDISKSMLEMILEKHLDYNVYVKEVKPIDEEKLDELAMESYNEPGYIGMDPMIWYTEGYKVGYRKAKEE